jgi:hypothetical protein
LTVDDRRCPARLPAYALSVVHEHEVIDAPSSMLCEPSARGGCPTSRPGRWSALTSLRGWLVPHGVGHERRDDRLLDLGQIGPGGSVGHRVVSDRPRSRSPLPRSRDDGASARARGRRGPVLASAGPGRWRDGSPPRQRHGPSAAARALRKAGPKHWFRRGILPNSVPPSSRLDQRANVRLSFVQPSVFN